MKEIKRISQHRRDFRSIYECEACGDTREIGGYDDENFHINVVPQLTCQKCGETTVSLGEQIIDNTVVPKGVVI